LRISTLNELILDSVTLEGRWCLDENQELTYRARNKGGYDEEVRFRGTLVAVEAGSLVVSLSGKKEGGDLTAGLVTLAGSWLVDSQNRIVFDVARAFGRADRLTLGGSWQLGDHHEIIYDYRRADLDASSSGTHTLVFRGVWDVSENTCLTYYVGGDSRSALKFRGAFQTKSILAKEGALRYQIGIGLDSGLRRQTITLFGKWKVSRDFELSFELTDAMGERRAIAFGGTYHPMKGTGISAVLKTRCGEPLGVELVLTREIFEGQGQLFVRLVRLAEKSAVEAGVQIPW